MSEKYWDIKPARKPKPLKKKPSIDKPLEELKKYELENRKLMPYRIPFDSPLKTECLHDNCPTCHGSGRNSAGGICLHMISCPCPKCSPTMLAMTQLVRYG